jgi:hypothetical protein
MAGEMAAKMATNILRGTDCLSDEIEPLFETATMQLPRQYFVLKVLVAVCPWSYLEGRMTENKWRKILGFFFGLNERQVDVKLAMNTQAKKKHWYWAQPTTTMTFFWSCDEASNGDRRWRSLFPFSATGRKRLLNWIKTTPTAPPSDLLFKKSMKHKNLIEIPPYYIDTLTGRS